MGGGSAIAPRKLQAIASRGTLSALGLETRGGSSFVPVEPIQRRFGFPSHHRRRGAVCQLCEDLLSFRGADVFEQFDCTERAERFRSRNGSFALGQKRFQPAARLQ
jgi:hypothetical protein